MKDDFRDYFQHEKRYLDELIDEFVQDYPDFSDVAELCKSDPDVRKILESGAFLFSKLNQKLDDAFPEMTQNLLFKLWPSALRPLPATLIAQLQINDTFIELPAHTNLMVNESRVFSTTEDLQVIPAHFSNINVTHTIEQSILQFTLTFDEKTVLDCLYQPGLSIFLGEEADLAATLQLYLTQYVKQIVLIQDQPLQISPAIFSLCEVTDPRQSTVDYLSRPMIQQFIRLTLQAGDISVLALAKDKPITFEVTFSRPLPSAMQSITPSMRLNCVTAVNIFKHLSPPYLFGQPKYALVLPPNLLLYDLNQIKLQQIENLGDETGAASLTLLPVSEFSPRYHGHHQVYYYELIQEKDSVGHLLYFLYIIDEKGLPVNQPPNGYVFQCEYLCLSYPQPMTAHPNSCRVVKSLSKSLSVTYLSDITASQPPALNSHQHWQLLDTLSLNPNLLTVEVLVELLNDFHLYPQVDTPRLPTQLRGIKALSLLGIDWLIQGVPERGLKLTLTLDSQAYCTLGEMYQFGVMIARLMTYYVESTSFLIVEIRDLQQIVWHLPLQRGRKSPI